MNGLYVRQAGAWVAAVGTTGAVTPPPPVNSPPTAVGSLAASSTSTSITLSWTAASDPDGDLDHYEVFLNGSTYGQVGLDLSVTLGNLSSGTTYVLGVRAVDATGRTGPVAQKTVTTVPTGTTITHGDQLTRAMVGPSAIGRSSFTSWSTGTTLTTSSAKPGWVTRVTSAAETIDGFTMPAGTWVCEGVSFTSYITISGFPSAAAGIVFRGCKFRRESGSGNTAIQISSGANPGNKPVLMSYCDTGGLSSAQRSQFAWTINDKGLIVYRTYSSLTCDGLHFAANLWFIENYMELPTSFTGDHVNVVLSNGAGAATDVRFLRNALLMNTVPNMTGCFTLLNDFSGFNGVLCQDNLLGGGGFVVRAGQKLANDNVRNVKIIGNKITTRFEPNGGVYGVLDLAPSTGWGAGGNEWTNNTWADGPQSGQEIPG